MITTLVFSPSDMPGLLIQADPTITPENAANYGHPLLEAAHKYQIRTPLADVPLDALTRNGRLPWFARTRVPGISSRRGQAARA